MQFPVHMIFGFIRAFPAYDFRIYPSFPGRCLKRSIDTLLEEIHLSEGHFIIHTGRDNRQLKTTLS